MNTIKSFVNVMILSSVLGSTVSFADGVMSYHCVGLDQDGTRFDSNLTLTPIENSKSFKSLWTYSKPGSTPDEGFVTISGQNRMTETPQNTQTNNGTAQFYQISDKQLLINHEGVTSADKVQQKNLGLCTLIDG